MSFVNVLMTGNDILIASDGQITVENGSNVFGFNKTFRVQKGDFTIWAAGTGNLDIHKAIKNQLLQSVKGIHEKGKFVSFESVDAYFKDEYLRNKQLIMKYSASYLFCGTDHKTNFCNTYKFDESGDLQAKQYIAEKGTTDLTIVSLMPKELSVDPEKLVRKYGREKGLMQFANIKSVQRQVFKKVSEVSNAIDDEYFVHHIKI